MTQQTSTKLSADIQIPGYKILRKINSGGMASVFLATQLSLSRTVALKIMKPELDYDPEFHQRFQREAEIVGQLSHPNIIPIYDIGRYNGMNYISMEYLPASSLDQKILHGVNASDACAIVSAMASALEHAHTKGYVHRDIKPENILFRTDGSPVLTDFGIARTVKSNSTMTQVGSVMGTPAYMSPEQARGEASDGRSDLYSLGILFYEMLTGSLPFRSDDALALALQHITEQPPKLPLQAFAYQDIIDKLLAKKPAQRFQRGNELISKLDDIKNSSHPLLNQAQSETNNTQLIKAISYTLLDSIRKTLRTRFHQLRNLRSPQEPLLNSSPDAALHETVLMGATNHGAPSQQWPLKIIAPVLAICLLIGASVFVLINNTGTKPKSLAFKVVAEPEFARVRILNIKERYKPNMELAPGNYQVQISAAGYETLTQWVEFNKAHQSINVSLNKNTDVRNLLAPELIAIDVTSFNNGNAQNAAPDKNFLIGKYEITFDEYDYFAVANNLPLPSDNGWGRGTKPVINVSWDDAQAYLNWLSNMNGRHYRLPTNAEWNLAANGNNSSLFWWGNNEEDAALYANCRFGCKPWYSVLFGNKTEHVGVYLPNSFGLYDTAGNVAEWTADCAENATENSPCTTRVIRGGSYADKVNKIAAHATANLTANTANTTTGFRVVQDLDSEKSPTTEPGNKLPAAKERVQKFFQKLFK